MRFFVLLLLIFIRLFNFITIASIFLVMIIFFINLLSTLITNNNVTNFFVIIVNFLEFKVLRFAISVKIFIYFVLIARFLKSLKLL